MRAINRNKIIAVMAAIVVFMVSMCTYSAEANATNTSRTYKVYDAQSPSEDPIREYELLALKNNNTTRSLIEDNRYPDWSKSGVVKIMNSAGYNGTGFVVDEHTIATAAHCVYRKSTDPLRPSGPLTVSNILLFDSEGNVEMNATPVEYHVPANHVGTDDSFDARYDYALITVEEDLSDYMCFNLGATLDNADEYDLDVKITGFPQEVTIDNNDETVNDYFSHNMYTSEGTITDVTEMQIVSYHYTSPGNSGGPIYIEETRGSYTYCSVLGILSSGVSPDYVCTTRITTDLLHFYLNNSFKVYE